MFGKKKRKELFGSNVALSCEYCLHNGGKSGEPPICTLRLALKNGKCKKYEYDPLRREPQTAPPLRGAYDEEDFKL